MIVCVDARLSTKSERIGRIVAEEKAFVVEEYLQIVWYRKWLIIVPLLTMLLITGVGSLLLNDVYRSYTLILVEAQQVPEEYVKSSVSFSVERHMATISQQILSRTLLERVIAEYNLFSDLIQQNVAMEDIVGIMRKNIELRVEGKDAFTLFFQGPDPYMVMQVTNKLASLFIEGSTQAREQQADDTVVFLGNSRDELKEELEVLEKKIREFKQMHIGELPEQLEANLRTIEGLQLQLQTNSDGLRGAENRYSLISGQLTEVRQKSMISGAGGEVIGSDVQLEKMRADLSNLQLRYTDEHPDVIELKSKIVALEKKLSAPKVEQTGSVMTRNLEMNLQSAQLDINRIKAERSSVRAQLRKYQLRVENTPKVEQELSILTRDYDNKRMAYESILAKLDEATRSAKLESKRKGQQFKVVDPAQQQTRPYKPNRPQIVAVGIALGLLIGFVSIFLAEHFDDSFKSPEEMEDFLGISVLTTIPKIETEQDVQKRQKAAQMTIVAACVVAAAFVILVIVKFAFKF